MVAAGLLALSTFFMLALGAPIYDALHVHDARAAAPAGYKASAAADPSEVLSLRIALKTDTSALVQKLMDVSTAGSKDYRNFLSKAQVRVVQHSCRAWCQRMSPGDIGGEADHAQRGRD